MGRLTLRRDVYVSPRDPQGAWLIDLSDQTFAISPHDAAEIQRMLLTGDPCALGRELHRELSWRRLLSTDTSATNQMAERLCRLTLAPFIHLCRTRPISSRLAVRLLTAARFELAFFSWPTVASVWTSEWHRGSARGVTPDEIRTAVADAASGLWLTARCKERSLAAFALCTLSGLTGVVRTGCNRNLLELHCWTEAEGYVVSESYDRRCEFNLLASWPERLSK
jgi:hypothetical protein